MTEGNDQSDRDDAGKRFVRPWEQGALTEDPFQEHEVEAVFDEEAGSDEEDAGVAFVLAPDEPEPVPEPDADADADADSHADAEAVADADSDAVADADADSHADAEAVADADADSHADAGQSSANWLDDLQDVVGDDDDSARLSDQAYSASTTREYQDLAEEIARSRDEEVEQQAVAATLAGVGSGLIGFDDVTGRQGLREEDVEHIEQERASDLTLRVVSAVILVGLLLISMALGGIWLVSFVTVVLVVALGEFYATVRSQGHNPVALFGLLAGLLSVVGGYSGGPAVVGSLLLLCLIATVLFLSLVRRSDPLGDGALTMLGVAWVSLLGLAGPIIAAERGRALVLLIVLLVAVLDMGAYFVGKAFGRRPLAPELSPNKTVEGLVGGIVAAFAVAAIASTLPLFDPVNLAGALILAGAVSVMAPIGDAAESLIKRLLGVKDMGSVLPGHGGMLDRIDGILFSVPAAYLVYELLGYL